MFTGVKSECRFVFPFALMRGAGLRGRRPVKGPRSVTM
jgi:hypothetical protein